MVDKNCVFCYGTYRWYVGEGDYAPCFDCYGQITFGKYKGKRWDYIDDKNYLKWVLKNVKLEKPVKDIIEERLSEL